MSTNQLNLLSPIQYFITEDLQRDVAPPHNITSLVFEVDKYSGGGFDPASDEGIAASAHVTITNTLNRIATVASLPPKWSTTNKLQVLPFAGVGLNAYYNRKHLAFFYDKDKNTDKWFFTSSSHDIVAHELGHAILDALRPDLWSAASLEIWAFHEAFADIVSMLSLMQYPEILTKIIEQTSGDLRKHNVASNIGEAFSLVLASNGYGEESGFLRSGINDFKYTDPQFLPNKANSDSLSKEPHSFSRVFFGAVYDILVMIYEDLKKFGDEKKALRDARNIVSRYIAIAVSNAPASVRFFEAMAKTMLWVDFNEGKPWHDRMYTIFSDRKIIHYDFKTLSLGDMTGHVVDHGNGLMSVCKSKVDKLCHCSKKLHIQSDEMYNIDLEIPRTDIYIHDRDGRLIDVHKVSESESVLAAEEMVNYLKKIDGVDDNPETPFEIKEGKLERTLICCCSGGRTPLRSSPEYFKPYKRENHSGCCGGCKNTNKTAAKRKVRRGCFVRYRVN